MLLLLLAVGGPLRAQPSAETAWLNQHIAPIEHLRAGRSLADLRALAPLVAGARVVALGECTHGSREVFQLKHRLLEYLVTEHGFNTFAIEADYAFGQILNEYVRTGQGDSLTVRHAPGYAVWQTTEVWDMIAWIRAYNQTHITQIQYVGIDTQNPFPNLLMLKHFAEQRADSALKNQLFRLFDQHQLIKNKWETIPPNTRRRIRQLSAQVEQRVRAAGAPAGIQQNARVLSQLADQLQAPARPVRDQAMAANTSWILAQNPAAKVVLWAHNEHIRKNEDAQQRLGFQLRRELGPAYVAVGFATGTGTMSTYSPTGQHRIEPLQAPIPDSFEARLNQADPPVFLLNLRAIGVPTAASRWLSRPQWFRLVGARLTSADPRRQFSWQQPLPTLFDALIYLRQTSASQPY